ncbi:MAG: hypothetical protein P8N02_05680 [Actinomycetota bacterium]|nr:hypothetical protein [Actinomycetota bacterium]
MRDAESVTSEVPVRRTITGILDHGFELMRQHRTTVVLLAVAVVLPLSVVGLVLQIQFIGLDGLGDPFGGFDDDAGTNTTMAATSILLSSLQVTLMAGAVTPLVTGTAGPDPGAAQLAGQLLRRLPAVLVGWVLVKALQAVGALGFLIGAAFMMVFCSLVTPVIMTLTANPFRAIGTSFRLVSKGFGRSIAVIVLMVVVDNSIRLSFVTVPGLVAAWTGWTLGSVAVAVLSVAGDLLSASFVALATASLFVDLRVRIDNVDLQRRFEAAGVSW